VTDKDGQTVVVSEVGMMFESEKDTYEMYNTYAGQIEFSIRKSNTKRRVDKSKYLKLIVCSSQRVEKLVHLKAVQGPATMLIFTLVSADRRFGQCIRLKLDTFII
jgi:hypothetical protein